VQEPQVVAFIERVVQEGWVAADIGAFAGYYTLLLSKLVGPTGQVHSFEPVPENFELLDSNVKLNRCGNVAANQLAVGAHNEETKFTRLRGFHQPYGTLLPRRDRSRYEEISVPARSLDIYLASRGWPCLHFAKIDVEGGEARVLEGMSETLRRFSPVLVIEIHDRFPHDRVEVRKALPPLFGAGYSVYSLEDDPELKFPIRAPEAWAGERHCVAIRTVPHVRALR
jgi:FkbM family methyltransferase